MRKRFQISLFNFFFRKAGKLVKSDIRMKSTSCIYCILESEAGSR